MASASRAARARSCPNAASSWTSIPSGTEMMISMRLSLHQEVGVRGSPRGYSHGLFPIKPHSSPLRPEPLDRLLVDVEPDPGVFGGQDHAILDCEDLGALEDLQ